jgi:hypothetical protein
MPISLSDAELAAMKEAAHGEPAEQAVSEAEQKL